MAQVQNLLDLFQAGAGNGRKPTPPAGANAPAKAKARGSGNLLPVAPASSERSVPSGRTASKAKAAPHPPSFQAAVEKSRAKLTEKDNAAANPRPEHRAATAPRHADKAHPKSEAHRKAPDRPEAKDPADSRPARPGRTARDRDPAAGPSGRTDDSPAEEAQNRASAAAPADAESPASEAKPDAEDLEAVKKGLEAIGIEADDEQLNDPAFLAEILRILRGMALPAQPTAAAPAADAGDGDAEIAAAGAVAADDAADAPDTAGATDATDTMIADAAAKTGDPMPSAAKSVPAGNEIVPSDAAAKDGNPRPVTRKELMRLLEGRIAELEKTAGKTETRGGAAAAQPVAGAKEGPVQPARDIAGPAPEAPAPLDPDRLRVLQTAAQQAALPGETKAAGADLTLPTDSDAAEPVSGPSAAAARGGDKEADAAAGENAGQDLAGQDRGDAAVPEAAVSKDGTAQAKDPAQAPGADFRQSLDLARAADRHPGPAHGAEARPAAQDPAVLAQIARKMSATSRMSGDEISIQLTPEHLGKVRVSLERKDDGMSARIAVENDAVRKQVESNLASLKDALRDQGVQLQGLEVSVDQRHSSLFNPDGSNADSFFRRQGRGEGGDSGSASPETAPFESLPESDTGRRWGYNTMEFIG